MPDKVGPDGSSSPESLRSAVAVGPLETGDVEPLRPILETWIRSRDSGELLSGEVEEVLQFVRDSVEGRNNRTYLVAKSPSGEVLGMIGFKEPEGRMKEFSETGNAVELVNAYVAKEYRGEGVGRALVGKLEEEARARGYKEVVLNSGPRYRDTGWGFYDKLEGYERVGVIEKMYGEGGDAVVWRKVLL